METLLKYSMFVSTVHSYWYLFYQSCMFMSVYLFNIYIYIYIYIASQYLHEKLLKNRNIFYLWKTISRKIQEAGKKKMNKKESIRTALSREILKQYWTFPDAAIKTTNDRRKLPKVNGKVINIIKTKKGSEPFLYGKVWNFFFQYDVSATLSRNEIQKW